MAVSGNLTFCRARAVLQSVGSTELPAVLLVLPQWVMMQGTAQCEDSQEGPGLELEDSIPGPSLGLRPLGSYRRSAWPRLRLCWWDGRNEEWSLSHGALDRMFFSP